MKYQKKKKRNEKQQKQLVTLNYNHKINKEIIVRCESSVETYITIWKYLWSFCCFNYL